MFRRLADEDGSTLIEFTLVFPLLALVALGTVDMAYMFYDWARADKATYAAAHRAILIKPIATQLGSPQWNTDLGDPCWNGSTSNCSNVAVTVTCTPTATSGTCSDGTNTYTWDDAQFTNILGTILSIFGCSSTTNCPIQRTNVSVVYTYNQLGFVGQPEGVPVNVQVSTSCMVHNFYFIGGLMNWAFPQVCSANASGWAIPAYTTTLSGEAMGCYVTSNGMSC